ncbi:hypothetical protein P886_3044 [Alteromonadaceae bacterium 2753L.S.0a.02]|nr:hypothetical protein P886_3044 [Alteromonadaceae bacterium 2753L.S.0a.02]
MTISRENQVCLEATPFYHCYVRCVRRAYLCGEDYSTGENFDHRKQWIVSRLKFLSYVYAIDICAFAVMSNHYHVVLHVDKARAESWSRTEVVERWMQLYNGDMLVSRWLKSPGAMDDVTREAVFKKIEEWRERLYDIGWFMRGVNETIARMANKEENCKGRFWEGRYKSQALLDEAALLSCMAYVDLNPVRAGMEQGLVDSDFTSIQQRLFDFVKYKNKKSTDDKKVINRVKHQRELAVELELDDLPEASLMAFDGSSHTDIHTALPFTKQDYFQLVDTSGRLIREGKRGAIPSNIAPIVQRFGLEADKWLAHIENFGRTYGRCAGQVARMKDYVARFEKVTTKGVRSSGLCYALSG